MERSPFAKLLSGERYWRDHYHWLLDQGYQLRPRLHPEWIPSWEKDPSRKVTDGEDWIASHVSKCDVFNGGHDSCIAAKQNNGCHPSER